MRLHEPPSQPLVSASRSCAAFQAGAYSLGISVALLEQPVVELFRNGISFVVQLVNIPRPRMRNPHDRPQRLGLALSFVRVIFCVSHFPCIIIQNLPGPRVSRETRRQWLLSAVHTCSISSKPSGGFFVLDVRILGICGAATEWLVANLQAVILTPAALKPVFSLPLRTPRYTYIRDGER